MEPSEFKNGVKTFLKGIADDISTGLAHQTPHLHGGWNHNQRGFVQMNIDLMDNYEICPAMYFLVES